MDKFGLDIGQFGKVIDNIENRYLNLIYNPYFDLVCTREEFDRTRDYMEWKCAICGKKILTNWRRYDVENFVCDSCKEVHNNKNQSIDPRILNSRTKMFNMITDRIYQELEDNLKLR